MNKRSILIAKHNRLGDFLACCILLSRYPEITNISRTVLDQDQIMVGFPGPERYGGDDMHFTMKPALHSHLPSTPLGFVLEHLQMYQLATAAWPWLRCLEIQEQRGLKELANHLECPIGAVERLFTPLDAIIVAEFNGIELLDERHALFQQMIHYGDALVRQLSHEQTVDNWVASNYQIIIESGLKIICVTNVPPWPVEQAINRFVMYRHKDTVGSVIPDPKGPGWAFFRFRYHRALDFRRVEREPEVAFCSHDGSLLKTKDRSSCGPLIRRFIQLSKITK